LLPLGLLALLGACRTAMRLDVENHGDPITIVLLCGDGRYEQTIARGATVQFEPHANSCTVMLDGSPPSRDLVVTNRCATTAGCSLGVTFPPGSGVPSAQLSGSGSIAVVGNVATVR
jgi:hypothetical protein